MATIAYKSTSIAFAITGAEPVDQQMGNGRRTITPERATVTVYPDGTRHVHLEGPSIRRDGTRGRYADVGWSIGGRWDESGYAPSIVFELIAAADWRMGGDRDD